MYLKIRLQPKQCELEDAILKGSATIIGYGGSRGGAKSGGIRRVALIAAHTFPGTTISIWMRNYKSQLKANHIDMLLREFPELVPHYRMTDEELHLPWCKGLKGHSVIHFRYADTVDDLRKKTYGPEYQFIFVDQAEQFTESEIQSLLMCNRAPGTGLGQAKIVLAFNPGDIGFGYLKRIFWDREYHDGEDPAAHKFIRAFVWDNIEWSRQALIEDGYTEKNYYKDWTEEQRKNYTITRSQYGAVLAALPPELREPMLYGSMEIVSGQYFQPAYDKVHTVVDDVAIEALMRPWWKLWMSGDWGHSHYTAYYWHARGRIDPELAWNVLGLKIEKPVSVIVTYREWIGQGLSEQELGAELLKQSSAQERGRAPYDPLHGMPEKVRAFYLSPDAFELSVKRSGQLMISDEIAKIIVPGGLPAPIKANNARISGARAMYGLLKNTKLAFLGKPVDTIWLISNKCHELTKAIPLAVRDTNNLEDILKTDTKQADVSADSIESARYGMMCREVMDPDKPQEEIDREKIAAMPNRMTQVMAQVKLSAEREQRTRRAEERRPEHWT
jgi:hypothetical protein